MTHLMTNTISKARSAPNISVNCQQPYFKLKICCVLVNSFQKSNVRVGPPRAWVHESLVPPYIDFSFLSVREVLKFEWSPSKSRVESGRRENKVIKTFPKSICLSDPYQIVTQMLVENTEL